MEIILKRYHEHKGTTYGTLYICNSGNVEICVQTIENTRKKVKKGKYIVTMVYSPKFNRKLYTLHVPGRVGIRIHSANRGSELSGCIAPVTTIENNIGLKSRRALEKFSKILEDKMYNINIYENFNEKIS